ncbi:HAD family phosphatase [Nonomuraea sp. NPDC050310]|uniref:HAD family hydrolase n=1 Tax=Nonomuraea sp. NPDC050310 TaxID=3154935 RepID=UPI003410DCFE
MPFDAVLFDMDGTLVDTEGLWWEAASSVARGLGVRLTGDDADSVHGRTVADTAAHLLSRATSADRAPDGRAPDMAAVSERLTEEFAARIAAGVRFVDGALGLLGELAAGEVPTALVSASPRRIVDLVLKQLPHPFRTVVADGETPRGKPYPDPYLEAISRLGVEPARCVAIEDSPTGIAAARAAGCRVLTVPRMPTLAQLHSLDRPARS